MHAKPDLRVLFFACKISVPSRAYCQVRADAERKTEYKFFSQPSKDAVRTFALETSMAEQEFQTAINAAREKFKAALHESLKVSANQGNLEEVKAITETLQLEDQKLNPPKKNDPIVGRWDYNNGNVCDFTPDGFVVLNAKVIAIWRIKPQGGYVVAFTRDFWGIHDDVVIDPSGAFFKGKGAKSTTKVDRVR